MSPIRCDKRSLGSKVEYTAETCLLFGESLQFHVPVSCSHSLETSQRCLVVTFDRAAVPIQDPCFHVRNPQNQSCML